MKTYKKPIAKIIELQSESILVTVSGEVNIGEDVTNPSDIGVNNHRVKLWED